jgi:hypothetical protein
VHDSNISSGLIRNTDAFPDPPDAQAVFGYEAYQYGPEKSGWARGFTASTLSDNVTRYVSNGAAVSVPSENLGFYFSGLRGTNWGAINESTDDWFPANTLVDVDMSTMRREQWANNTLPDNIPPRAGAELVWIPVGGQGVLVAIGGMTAVEYRLPAGLNSSQSTEANEKAPGFMTSLPVYDIVSKTWYTQNTTGDAPGQLTEFCSVVAPAKDSSSFNVYIYGGYDGLNFTSIPSDDVWILSIPSFTWVKAYRGVPGRGRRGHECERIYPDQILIIGGVNPDAQQCLEEGPIQIFNLNTLKFQNVYDPREWAEYAVPEVVTAIIGGNGQGGSTRTATFSDNALASLFKTPYTKTIHTYYPYPPASGSPSSTPIPTATPAPGGLAKWVAPVLGVVLGLIVLSIIAVLFLLYRRRKSTRRNSMTSSNAGSRNRILNWVNGMPNQPSDRKTDASVTSTEVDSDTHVSSPLVGRSEVAGQERYEVEAKERERPIAEMPTQYNFEDHPSFPRPIDFAYGVDRPSQTQPNGSGAGSGNGSETRIHGLGLSSPSTAVSPQSPHSTATHPHSHTHSRSGRSSTGGSVGNDRSGAPSPYVLPHSPEDVGSAPSPSPTSSVAVSPDLKNTTMGSSNTVGGAGSGTLSSLERRPTHHRNVSSLSSHIYQLPSPEIVLSPEEDMRRSQFLSGLAGSPSQNQIQSGAETGRLGALDAAAAAVAEGEPHVVSPEEQTQTQHGLMSDGGGGAWVERKKSAGKKTSFSEMLDEEQDEKGGK